MKQVCPKCKAKAVKNGFQNSKQRYKCSVCKHRFQEEYSYKAYWPHINKQIVILLKEGCGVRSISRILQITTHTVLRRMLAISKNCIHLIFH